MLVSPIRAATTAVKRNAGTVYMERNFYTFSYIFLHWNKELSTGGAVLHTLSTLFRRLFKKLIPWMKLFDDACSNSWVCDHTHEMTQSVL